MNERQEKRLRNKIRKATLSDEGMVRALDHMFGCGNYTYDPQSDVWVTRDQDYTGPGRGFIVVQRGGSWRKIVLPAEVLQ